MLNILDIPVFMGSRGGLEILGGEARSDKVDPVHPKDPVLAEMFNLGNVSATGLRVTSDTAMEDSAVTACVRLISESIASLPLVYYLRDDNGGKERARDQSLYDILRFAPNRWQTPVEFFEMMTAHVLLRGNSYAKIVSTNRQGVAELLPLHPDRVYVFRAPDGRRAYQYITEAGKAVVYLQDEVFHVPGLSFNGLCGINPIRYHRETIGLSLAAKEFGARTFGQGAHHGGVYEHPGTLSDNAYERLKKSIRENSGLAGTAKTLILEENMKFNKISMTSEDAQYLESRRFSRSEIASIFRVPPHMIGETDKSTSWGTGIEQQTLGFIVFTLIPWLTRIEQAILRDLISSADRKRGYFAEFLLNGLLRGDAAARSAYYKARWEVGTLSQNDIRRLENENPITGGDTYFVPLNFRPHTEPWQGGLKNAPTE